MSELHCYNPTCNTRVSLQDIVCPNCGSTLLLLDKYRIIGVLGQGGFGYVYEAVELDLNDRRCAIKEVMERPPALSKQQIEQEVTVLARISGRFHFIPDIYARWSADQRHYIVMQYIDGKTVEKVRALPWSPKDVQHFVHVLLGHLDQLHTAEVVHRDIKPQNIKYTPERGYVLLDFGLATHRSNTIIHGRSPDFAPPEQFPELRAANARTDARSDLYSLAATAYYLLTAIPPTRADLRKQGRLLEPPRQREAIPPALERAILRMLAFNIEERPASAREALKILDDDRTTLKLGTEPSFQGITTSPIGNDDSSGGKSSTTQRGYYGKGRINSIAWSPDSRHLAIASAIGVYEFTPTTSEERLFKHQSTPVQHIAYALDNKALVWAVHGDIALWQIQPRQLLHTIVTPAVGDDGLIAFACDAQGQTLAVASDKEVMLVRLSDRHTIGTIPADVNLHGLALTPHGDGLAIVTRTGVEIWRVRNNTLALRRTLRVPSQVVRVEFALDERVLIATATQVVVWDLSDAQPRCTIAPESGPIVSAAITSNGKVLAIATDHTVTLWQVAGAQYLRTLAGEVRGMHQIAFSPNGDLVAGVSHEQGWVWQTNNGALFAPIDEHLDCMWSLAASADGQLLATMGGRTRLWEISGATLTQRYAWDGQSDSYNGVAFDPTGQILAAVSQEGVRLWQVQHGTLLAELAGSAATQAHGVVFTDQGQTLLNVGAGAIQRWQMADYTMQPMLATHLSSGEYDVALASNGRWVATFANQAVQVWRNDGTLYRRLTTDIDINSVAVTLDGRWLAVASHEATQIWTLDEPPARLANRPIGAQRVVWSPDGDQVALLYDAELFRWRWRDPEAVLLPHRHADTVTDAVFLPGGGVLISTSKDGTIRLWGLDESTAARDDKGDRS